MNQSDRDELLIRVDERTQRIDGVIKTHLKHHWTVHVGVITAVITGLIAMTIAMI